MDTQKDKINLTPEQWKEFQTQIEEKAEEVMERNEEFELRRRPEGEAKRYIISTIFKEVERLKVEISDQYEMLNISLEALNDFYRERGNS